MHRLTQRINSVVAYKVLVICQENICCFAMQNLFDGDKDFQVVGYKDTLDDAIKSVEKQQPDLLLICSHFLMREGFECILKIRKITNKSKFVVFNSSLSDKQELMLVKVGVVGIFQHTVQPPTIVDALRKICNGECWLRRYLIASLINVTPVEPAGDCKVPLTNREKEILSLIVVEFKNKEIASSLFISEKTVKTHINHIFKKLGVEDRKEAILYAVKCNHTLKNPLTNN